MLLKGPQVGKRGGQRLVLNEASLGKAFLSGMARKEQLPFSIAYGVGLVRSL